MAVSSVEGEGTTFTASIVINANNAENVQADAIKYDAVVLAIQINLSTRAEHTILIIDDDPTVRDLMKRQLERDGFGVLIAEDGPLGIKWQSKAGCRRAGYFNARAGRLVCSKNIKASKETANIPKITNLDEKNRGFHWGRRLFIQARRTIV